MRRLNFEGKSREEARRLILNLPRDEDFLVWELKDGRRVWIRTDGRKKSIENGIEIGNYDFTIHYEGEERKVSYLDDIIVDLIKKEVVLGRERILELIEGIREAIELKPIGKILERFKDWEDLPGHPIELILVLMMLLGIQEDVNYWGTNPRTGEPYEGRYKPYNAIYNYFVRGEGLKTVIKKHKL
ncbi:MAG: hypothetical protein ACXQTS_02775 [Candidatus Methanospirareceae archaeon]